MQRFKILIKNITGTSENILTEETPENSGLKLINNYYSYSSEIGNSIVNDNNVKNFLDDEKNSNLTEKFIDYLKDNTDLSEFKTIFYDNKKLASVFNEFYNNTIVKKSSVNIQISKQIQTNNDNTPTINTEPSNNVIFNPKADYYIPIYSEQSRKLVDRGDYSEYSQNCKNGSYTYKRFTYLNNLNKTTVFGNSAYINSIKGNTVFGTIPVQDNPQIFPIILNSSTASLAQMIQFALQQNEFKLFHFQTFSQFQKFTNWTPPVITGNTGGFHISQDRILIANNQVFTPNYVYYNQDLNFQASFITNQLQSYDKLLSSTTVPVRVDLSRPSIGSTEFLIVAESFSTATIGNDYELNISNPGTTNRTIHFNHGQQSNVFNITVFDKFNPEETIALSLRTGNTTISLLLIRGEDLIEINSYTNNSYISIDNELMTKLMLNCFVDYNFNDNESQFWKNDNIRIVDNTLLEQSTTSSDRTINNNNTINKLASIIGTKISNIQNVYRFGSIVFGTQNQKSDLDYIIVLNNYKVNYENFHSGNINIQIYTVKEFIKEMNKNSSPVIETKFYPQEFILKESLNINLKINKFKIKDSYISQAITDYKRAKRNISSGNQTKYFIKKNIFHAFRKLLFGIILIENGKLDDLTIGKNYYNFIFSKEFNSEEEIDQLFLKKFNELIVKIKSL